MLKARSRQRKYYARVALPRTRPGERLYRYFYSKDEYSDYLNRKAGVKSPPSFDKSYRRVIVMIKGQMGMFGVGSTPPKRRTPKPKKPRTGSGNIMSLPLLPSKTNPAVRRHQNPNKDDEKSQPLPQGNFFGMDDPGTTKKQDEEKKPADNLNLKERELAFVTEKVKQGKLPKGAEKLVSGKGKQSAQTKAKNQKQWETGLFGDQGEQQAGLFEKKPKGEPRPEPEKKKATVNIKDAKINYDFLTDEENEFWGDYTYRMKNKTEEDVNRARKISDKIQVNKTAMNKKYSNGQTAKEFVDEKIGQGYNNLVQEKQGAVRKWRLKHESKDDHFTLDSTAASYAQHALSEKQEPKKDQGEPDGRFKGDAYRLTGKTKEDAGTVWNEAELLEGHRKGEKVYVSSKESKQREVEKNKKQWEDRQAAFRRVKEIEEKQKSESDKLTEQDADKVLEEARADKAKAEEHYNYFKNAMMSLKRQSIKFGSLDFFLQKRPELKPRYEKLKNLVGELEKIKDGHKAEKPATTQSEPDQGEKLSPYEMGKRAFEQGKISAPAQDKDFIDAYMGGKQVGESNDDLKEWQRGWHEANLAAPIPSEEAEQQPEKEKRKLSDMLEKVNKRHGGSGRDKGSEMHEKVLKAHPYKEGTRVKIIDGEGKGRHGTVDHTSAFTLTSYAGELLKEPGYYANVKTDNGKLISAINVKNLQPEAPGEKPDTDSIAKDVLFEGSYRTPSELEYLKDMAQNYIKYYQGKAARAKKPENIAAWQTRLKKEKGKLREITAKFNMWASENPTHAKEQFPEDFKNWNDDDFDTLKKLAKLQNQDRYKTASDENVQKLYERRLNAIKNIDKWEVGHGVGYKVNSGRGEQINRGFRIVDINRDKKEVKVKSIADTGLTTTGGHSDKISDQWVHIGDLVRDRKYNKADVSQGSDVSSEPVEVNSDFFNTGSFTHSKHGHTLHVASMKQRVSRDKYNELAAKAKAQGGYYSRYSRGDAIPGFVFRSSEKLQAFIDSVESD